MSRHVPVPLHRVQQAPPQGRRPAPQPARRVPGLEFIRQVAAKSMTVLEPGYNQDEVFDDQFERRAREIQRTPSGDNAISIVPQKRGPWSGNNQLGIEKPFAPDENNRQTILRLDEWDFPDVWTLAFGLNEFAKTLGGFDVTAIIEFGVGGVTQYVEVDWLNGSAISLPMNALNVVAQYNLINEEVAGEVPDDLRLRVSISKLPAQNLRPTRSFLFTDAVLEFDIPPFAKAVHVSTISLNAFTFYNQAVGLLFETRTGVSAGLSFYQLSQFVTSMDVANTTVGAPAFIPIPPFARSCKFVSVGVGADSPQQCIVQFLIGL